jgi:hypothetical protein
MTGSTADALFVPDGDSLVPAAWCRLRVPVGEWVRPGARTRIGPPGGGLAESAPWDGSGRIGRALRSLFVERSR